MRGVIEEARKNFIDITYISRREICKSTTGL